MNILIYYFYNICFFHGNLVPVSTAVEQQFEKPSMVRAMQMYKLVLKLQEADMEATFFDGK